MSLPPQKQAVAAFYRFQPLTELPALREFLLDACREADARGIILLAPEGINGTISASPDRIDGLMERIRLAAGLEELPSRRSIADAPPFKRLKVRLKKEIVTIGDTSVDPRRAVGTYVDPAEWNALIADPEVLVVDTRNAFEVSFGTFEGAVDPGIGSFGAFPEWVRSNLDPARHRKVAMFCTGGIRCEKASSFMLDAGFEEVLHLEGGILNYLETVAPSESLWRGGCFVFDERVALGHGLAPVKTRLCLSCNAPVDAEAMSRPGYEEGVSCPQCVDKLTPAQKASARERQKQMVLARQNGAT